MTRAALRVVRGDPTAEEVAALSAVIASARARDEPDPAKPDRGGWSDPAQRVRRYWRPGPGGWRSAR